MVATAVAVVMQEEVPLAAPIGVPGPAAGKTSVVVTDPAMVLMLAVPVGAAVAATMPVATAVVPTTAATAAPKSEVSWALSWAALRGGIIRVRGPAPPVAGLRLPAPLALPGVDRQPG